MSLTQTLSHLTLFAALSISQLAWCEPHLELDVSLNPDKRTLNASASIATESAQLVFFLADEFVLETVEVEGATVPTDRTSADGMQRFQIELHGEASRRNVKLRYHGELQALDESMAHHDTLTALAPMAARQGSYLPGNSGWHPLFESTLTYQISVHVPEGQIAVAPGTLSSESTSNGSYHATFTLNQAIDNIDLMVGPWQVGERNVQVGAASIQLRTYFYADSHALSKSYLDAAQQFIKRYSKLIGAYPYAGFSIVASPIPTGFGMPSLTYLGKNVLHYPFIRDISLGHEILHSWWGNGIRVDPQRGNWAEGLTTFMADYAYKEDEGPAAATSMRHDWLRNYASLPVNSEKPLSAFHARHRAPSAAIGYGKSAMLFYALRARLGNEVFHKGLRGFWQKHSLSHAGFDQLRQAFEESSGKPLDTVFNQWLDQTGAPDLRITQARALGIEGKPGVQISLSQGKQVFRITVPLRFSFSDQESGKAEQTIRVHLSEPDQSFKLLTRSVATFVQIDPDFEVWRRLKPEEAPPVLSDLIAAEQILVTALDQNLQEPALALAHELAEGKAKQVKPDNHFDPPTPVLAVGSASAASAFLKRLSLPERPADIKTGSTEVWMVNDPSRKVVIVQVQPGSATTQELSQIGRRLRHFGRYAWVSFSDDSTATRGRWAVTSPRIAIRK